MITNDFFYLIKGKSTASDTYDEQVEITTSIVRLAGGQSEVRAILLEVRDTFNGKRAASIFLTSDEIEELATALLYAKKVIDDHPY